ncbi:MAG: hypothetical protein RBR30_03470 [Tenuifilaceae bacterium]|nr:hypothetical protein [Tenuifilaceae bacterium]
MNNITYLFGAGASYNACPILNEMGDKMMELPEEFDKKFTYTESEFNGLKSSQDRLLWLIGSVGKNSKEFNTIDTYAKKLFLLGKYKELKGLKLAVSLFFTLWSLTDNKEWRTITSEQGKTRECREVDPRYISLLATFLEKGERYPKLRDEVNFVTWNYDLQLEEAYRKFTDIEAQDYNVVNQFFPFNPNSDNLNIIKCCHLNGFQGYYGMGEGRDMFNRSDSKNLARIVEELLFLTEPDPKGDFDFNHFINYAWEEESSVSAIARERAIKIFSETYTLVVIGYSFPPFNHKIDKMLLESAKGSLQRLIIQDPIADEEYISETFGIHKGIVKVVRDVKQFVVPNYYELSIDIDSIGTMFI